MVPSLSRAQHRFTHFQPKQINEFATGITNHFMFSICLKAVIFSAYWIHKMIWTSYFIIRVMFLHCLITAFNDTYLYLLVVAIVHLADKVLIFWGQQTKYYPLMDINAAVSQIWPSVHFQAFGASLLTFGSRWEWFFCVKALFEGSKAQSYRNSLETTRQVDTTY